MVRASPTARTTKPITIIVQIVIGARLLTLASLRCNALLRLRAALTNFKSNPPTKLIFQGLRTFNLTPDDQGHHAHLELILPTLQKEVAHGIPGLS